MGLDYVKVENVRRVFPAIRGTCILIEAPLSYSGVIEFEW